MEDEVVIVTPHEQIALPQGYRWQPLVREEAKGLMERKLTGVEGERVLEAAVSIIARGIDPTQSSGQVAGLVVGYVQSGKTLSFTTVAALARDNGFQIVIVIAGTSTPLLRQSTERLKRDLLVDELEGSWKWKVYENPESDENVQHSIRSSIEDWNDPGVQKSQCATILITVMKNHQHLSKLADLLRRIDMEEVPTLIIDDEADQASLNIALNRGTRSTTYERISELRRAAKSHTFLQYTATPQAPLLISLIDELSPQFVEVIDPGDGYIGGLEIFGMQSSGLTREIPYSDILSDDNPLDGAPKSLTEALRIFLVGVSAGLVQEGLPAGRRSMLVHPHQQTAHHHEFIDWITSIRADWERVLRLPETDPDYLDLMGEFRVAYDNLAHTVEDLPSFSEIATAPKLLRALRKTSIQEINARRGQTPSVDWNLNYGWILVGGQAMDRGFTVEGLTVTYMPRGTGVGNADVIQQRGRFFGYKREYSGFCRVYLEAEVLMAFQHYVEHEEAMRQSLKNFSTTGRPLSDWPRSFVLSPTLRPCRRNVIESGYVRGNFADAWFESRIELRPTEEINRCRQVIAEYIESLNFTSVTEFGSGELSHQHLVCENTPLKDLVSNLLMPCWMYSLQEDGHQMMGLLMQLQSALDQDSSETSMVYHMRPIVQSIRGVYASGRIRQVFQGKTRNYTGDREMKDSDRVSVQVHSYDLQHKRGGKVIARSVPVIAVWVPERIGQSWLVQR